MHTEFEQKTPTPSMFSHVYKVPKEINKWIVKIIIKNSHIGIWWRTELMINNLIRYRIVPNLKALT